MFACLQSIILDSLNKSHVCLLAKSVMTGRSSEKNTERIMLMPKGYARFQTHIYKLSYLLCDMLFIYREANVNLVLFAITYVLHVM